jgi:hypothetical protein
VLLDSFLIGTKVATPSLAADAKFRLQIQGLISFTIKTLDIMLPGVVHELTTIYQTYVALKTVFEDSLVQRA